MTEILDSYYIIENVKTKKYLKCTMKTKEQFKIELELEGRGSFYSDSLFALTFHQAVKIRDPHESKQILSWLNELFVDTFKMRKIEIIAYPYSDND